MDVPAKARDAVDGACEHYAAERYAEATRAAMAGEQIMAPYLERTARGGERALMAAFAAELKALGEPYPDDPERAYDERIDPETSCTELKELASDAIGRAISDYKALANRYSAAMLAFYADTNRDEIRP